MSPESKHPPEAGLFSHRPKGDWDDHEHRPREKGRLLFCLILTLGAMILEIIGGWISGSLALLSDAGHMFTHALSLAISYGAIRLANRPVGSHRSYGLFRIEVLAALFNGLTMFVIVAFTQSDVLRCGDLRSKNRRIENGIAGRTL